MAIIYSIYFCNDKLSGFRFRENQSESSFHILRGPCFRYHKTSGNCSSEPIQFESKIQNEYPDYPKRDDYKSKDYYNAALKDFFKDKGFKHKDDFDKDEKSAIVVECTENLIGPTELSKKYNTLPTVICTLVRDVGRFPTPDDLSKYPDFPIKSGSMSQDTYQAVIKAYWKQKKNQRQKERYKEKKKAARLGIKNDSKAESETEVKDESQVESETLNSDDEFDLNVKRMKKNVTKLIEDEVDGDGDTPMKED